MQVIRRAKERPEQKANSLSRFSRKKREKKWG